MSRPRYWAASWLLKLACDFRDLAHMLERASDRTLDAAFKVGRG